MKALIRPFHSLKTQIRQINRKYAKPEIEITLFVRISLIGLRIYLFTLIGMMLYKFVVVVKAGG